MTNQDVWLTPDDREPAVAADPFIGVDATVGDFWQFALGDLRMNAARGHLGEFLVGKALGLEQLRRVEWDAYDLLVDDGEGGITIEVKTSAYLQAWDQRRPSAIKFTGLRGLRTHPRGGEDPAGRRMNAMVYVFCVQTATEHASYDTLDVGQWEFYVVPRSMLDNGVRQSISITPLRQLAGKPVRWRELGAAVRRAGAGERRDDDGPWWS
ncbi:hypothetical protein [Frigoribacterium sp. SL97]|uniref:hypothetical protein n=1 Tax=Frigoribacterium sp. SL97 TaxID=2994664 RepID=UPI003B64269D